MYDNLNIKNPFIGLRNINLKVFCFGQVHQAWTVARQLAVTHEGPDNKLP